MLREHVATRFPRVPSPFMRKTFLSSRHIARNSPSLISCVMKQGHYDLNLQCRITALTNCPRCNIETNQYLLHVHHVMFLQQGPYAGYTRRGLSSFTSPPVCTDLKKIFYSPHSFAETVARIYVFWPHSWELLDEHVSLPVLVFQHFCSFCFKQFLQFLFPEI